MSISINEYYQKYYYSIASQNRSSSASESLRTVTGDNTDSADFSEIAKQYFNFTGDNEDDSYTDTYSAAALLSPQLLFSGMTSLLGAQESGTYTALGSDDSSASVDNVWAALQSLSYDNLFTTDSSDEFSSLFPGLSLNTSGLSGVNEDTADLFGQQDGIPAMLQALGGFPPPFAWGLENTETLDQLSSLTASDVASAATELQSLQGQSTAGLSNDTSAEASSSDEELLASLKALLTDSGYLSAADSERSVLLEQFLRNFA